MADAISNSAIGNSGERSAARPWRRRTAIYLASLALVAISFLLQLLFAPTLGNQALYLFLIPPVFIAGALGGIGPGLLATALSLGLHVYGTGAYANLLDSGAPLFVAEVSRAGTFAALGIGIAWFGERLQLMRHQAAAREAHLQSILDTVPEAMIVIDERGLMQSFSSAAERLFGYSANEVVGKNVKMMMPAPYRDNHD